MLSPGTEAPDFALYTTPDQQIKLSDRKRRAGYKNLLTGSAKIKNLKPAVTPKITSSNYKISAINRINKSCTTLCNSK